MSGHCCYKSVDIASIDILMRPNSGQGSDSSEKFETGLLEEDPRIPGPVRKFCYLPSGRITGQIVAEVRRT